MTTDSELTKTCTKCGVEKVLSAFRSDPRLKSGRGSVCKECKNTEKRLNNAKDPTKKAESDRRYREKNKAEIADKQKSYREEKGEELRAKKRVYYANTQPARRAASRAYSAEHVEENKARCSDWYKDNKDRAIASAAAWVIANPEKSRAIKKKHSDAKRSTPQGRLQGNISRGLHRGLSPGAKAGTRTFKILGYTPSDLVSHLESRFSDGMSWSNYGQGGWHVDHIRPLASFAYESPDDADFKMAWSLSNLQPLWWWDNLSKRDKWEPPPAANENGALADSDVVNRKCNG